MDLDRRQFLARATAVSAGFIGLQTLLSSCSGPTSGYGPLTRDPQGILDLPPGFSYAIISRAGDLMSDGFVVPAAADGMATFAGPDGSVVVVRNHEVNVPPLPAHGPFGAANSRLGRLPAEYIYDEGAPGRPCLGGTTTFIYDETTRRIQAQYLSLVGTVRNCAGGATPWGSWISCEEIVLSAGEFDCQRDHGYCFEVPAGIEPRVARPIPLKALGRFNHEAVAVDPRTQIIYLTEDRPDGLFYRFLPDEPGELLRGGRLQALAIPSRRSADTRNWERATVAVGEELDVSWIDLDDVESPLDDLRYRGFEKGAARFARGEGIWYGRNSVYFTCTNGGKAQKGQIFRYEPGARKEPEGDATTPGHLELFVEPDDGAVLESPDNLTVAPWGDLIVCEDGPETDRLVGITPAGEFYVLGRHHTESELAGTVFSPGGDTLFVNVQVPGLTLAITGPWQTS